MFYLTRSQYWQVGFVDMSTARQPVLGGLDGDEIVFASFFDADRAARLRRDPHVTLSFQAKKYDGGALHPYLVIDGRASVGDGGALAVMDNLAQWCIGPGAKYSARDMPPG